MEKPTQYQLLRDFCYWIERAQGNTNSVDFQIGRLTRRWKACDYRVETLAGLLPALIQEKVVE